MSRWKDKPLTLCNAAETSCTQESQCIGTAKVVSKGGRSVVIGAFVKYAGVAFDVAP